MNEFRNNEFIILKDDKWLERQRIAGKCVAKILKTCKIMVDDHLPNLSLMDFAEGVLRKEMKEFDCIPTFENYKGFPGSMCISVNEELVHGIPKEYVLKDGDVVKFDLGATFEGAIADAALTVIYGEPKLQEHVRLIKTCQEALYAGIKAAKVGNRIGAIGNAIHKCVKDSGFANIIQYGGHSLSYNEPHSSPFIANKANENEGARIQSGLTIAIEPLLCIGLDHSTTLDKIDNWTVRCKNIAAHFEKTIFIHSDKTEIITEY